MAIVKFRTMKGNSTDVFSIAGSDLAPDAAKDDEYVAIVDDMGVE